MSLFKVSRDILDGDADAAFIAAAKSAINRAKGDAAAGPLIRLVDELISGIQTGDVRLEIIAAYDLSQDPEYNPEDSPLNGPITQKQKGYIHGLCKKLRIDPHDMPTRYSPWPDDRGLTEWQGIIVIKRLKTMVDLGDMAFI